MEYLKILEEAYKKYTNNLSSWIPEGIIHVDLELLSRLGLIHQKNDLNQNPSLIRYFQVIESDKKVTLINDQFVIWIVPDKLESLPVTYTLIALNTPEGPQIEMAFSVSGVYNTSKLVLRILERFLHEIQETEELLSRFSSETPS